MSRIGVCMRRLAALVVAGTLASQPLVVVSPTWAGEGGKKQDDDQGKGKGKGHDKKAGHSDKGGKGKTESAHSASSGPGHRVFEDRHRVVVNEYYVTEYRAGRCPPGLAKKNNGCMPPGQAKKWQVGHPLPRDVVFYELPPTLIVQIGAPPPGYRYVRVAADILMIAVGTGLVIEAISDLGRM